MINIFKLIEVAMKRLSTAVFIASLSTLAQQANAESQINIKSEKIDAEMSDLIKAKLTSKDAQNVISNHASDFSESISLDGVVNMVDFEAYWASGKKKDSTNSGKVTVSYSACHSACHGSRGWR
jgi:hypothetical protein